MLDIKGGGLLLGDNLGIGKTVSAICPMAVPRNLPAVVIYPAYLPGHWPEKLPEFAPHLRVHHHNNPNAQKYLIAQHNSVTILHTNLLLIINA